MRRQATLPFIFGLLSPILFALELVAQAPPSPTGQKDRPLPLSSAPHQLTAEQIQTRITELQNTAEKSDAISQLIDNYRNILQRLEAERINLENRDTYKKFIETGPDEISQIRTQIQNPSGTDTGSTAAEGSPEPTVEQLQARLTQENAKTTDLKNRLTEIRKRIASEQERPSKAQTQLGEANAVLREIERDLAGITRSAESPESDQVKQLLLEARRKARTAEIEMLQQELLSNPVRLEWLAATRDLLTRQVQLAETTTKTLEDQIYRLRQVETERARLQAERLKRAAFGKHPLIQFIAEELNSIAQESKSLGQKITTTKQRRQTTDDRIKLIRTDSEEAKQTLELNLTNEALGQVLLEQRRTLPTDRKLLREKHSISADRAAARLRQFQVDRQLNQLTDIDTASSSLLGEPNESTTEEWNRLELEAEIKELLTTKQAQLKQLQQNLRAYILELTQLQLAQTEFTKEAQQMRAILNENLLWIPNAEPIGLVTFKNGYRDLRNLIQSPEWPSVLNSFLVDARQAAPTYAAMALLCFVLFTMRRRLAEEMEQGTARIGEIQRDKLTITLRAMLVMAILAVPTAAIFAFVGWRLSQGSTDLSQAIGIGIGVRALTQYVGSLIILSCKSGALAEKHFEWPQKNLRVIRRNLRWMLPIAVTSLMFIAFTESYPEPSYRQTMGRLVFLVLMLATAIFSYFVLHPEKGLECNEAAIPPWIVRTRGVWQSVGLIVPAALAFLAALGYYYVALALFEKIVQTIVIVVSAIVVFALLKRWTLISQRRLAFRLAREDRAEKSLSSEKTKPNRSGLDLKEAHPAINAAAAKDQTLELIRVSCTLAVAIGIWIVWIDILPAFKSLDSFKLWDQTETIDGESVTSPVTLFNLLLASITVFVTTLAARNMPGFLEIAVLQRLPFDQGARYAVRTLSLYLIVAIGIVTAFSVMGMSWNSVQWLVAALTFGLGFGLQEIFGNLVSGLIILLERPIRVGDTVTVGDVSGTVTQIRIRATTITDWNRKELIVPNKTFITDKLVNWTLSDTILRLDLKIGIAHGSDMALAGKTMLMVCREHPFVLSEPEPNVLFLSLGDSSLEFEVRVFVTQSPDRSLPQVRHDLLSTIVVSLREAGIGIAFPQRYLHLDTTRPLEIAGPETTAEDKQSSSTPPPQV